MTGVTPGWPASWALAKQFGSMAYRPQSPDLSSYQPRSPDLSAVPAPATSYRPQSPDLSGLGAPSHQGGLEPQQRSYYSSTSGFGGSNYSAGIPPTSQPIPQPQYGYDYSNYDTIMAPRRGIKTEDDDYMPDASARRSARNAQPQQPYAAAMAANGSSFPYNQQFGEPEPMVKDEDEELPDPTLGVALKTSFPVARIKRIMQADEDIGKVAQVTPHVVSRALELFMIKLISASAEEAKGGAAGKGPKRVLAQHMKKAAKADSHFDFLDTIMEKVPDAPTGKAGATKKEAGSESEEEKKPKKKSKKRKDSGDDM